MVSKKKLVKRKFPYIDTLDHEGPTVVRTMRDPTSGVFEHLEINFPMEVDQRVAYMRRILRRVALNKYKAVLMESKNSAKDLAGDKCTLGDPKPISTEDFWTWEKSDTLAYGRDDYLGLDKCVEFKKKLWFDFGKLNLEESPQCLSGPPKINLQ